MASRAVSATFTLEPSRGRRLDERIAVRFPRLRTTVARWLWRMPNTRLRRAIFRRAAKILWEAFNRRDLESCFALYHADVESVWPRELATLGLPSGTQGLEERVHEQRRVLEEWKELRFELEEYIDVGDGRILTVGRMIGVGLGSGATVNLQWTALVTTVDGQVVREEIFADNDRALAAAGITQRS